MTKSESWTVTFAVPSGAREGLHRLAIRAVDGLGNEAVFLDAVEIEVDATPPRLVDHVMRAGPLAAEIEVTASEPVDAAVTAMAAGESSVRAESDVFAAAHTIRLETLRPNTHYELEIRLTDAAGNANLASATLRTETDTSPPGPVREFRGASPVEGLVVLEWIAADDDHGIQAYDLWRSDTEAWSVLPPNTTRAELTTEAIEITVRIRARDYAANDGPIATVWSTVLAFPHLQDAEIPAGPFAPGEPVDFTVVYRHASGRPAKSVALHLQDLTFPMATADQDCAKGCRYVVSASLAATSYFSMADQAWFEASDGVHDTTTAKVAAPLVIVDGEAEVEPGAHSPGAGAASTVLAALAAVGGAWIRRRRSH